MTPDCSLGRQSLVAVIQKKWWTFLLACLQKLLWQIFTPIKQANFKDFKFNEFLIYLLISIFSAARNCLVQGETDVKCCNAAFRKPIAVKISDFGMSRRLGTLI